MKVEFHRGDGADYSVHIHRRDGVVVSLPGAGGRFAVPHDLAHFATERALGMAGGVFGSAASGAMFDSMVVVSGRLRHDPRRRSREVLRTNTKERTITVAESMTSLVHDLVQHGRHDSLATRAREVWGIVREDPCPYTPAQLQQAVKDLRALVDQWARTRGGGVLAADWPDELVTAGPAARARTRNR